MRTDYRRHHLREITGPCDEEMAAGMPLHFIVGGFFPDVPTTPGVYHKGDSWGQGKALKKSRYAGFRGDADPSNISGVGGIDDDEAYLPWLGTVWDIGGREKGYNPNRYLSRAPGAFGTRGGYRTGLSLDSYGTPVGSIASEFADNEDNESAMVNFSMTGAGPGRGFNAPGLYKFSRGSFGRKQGLRGSFLDGNIAQTGGMASEFADDESNESAMVDFTMTGAGPGRGFNAPGLYKFSRGSFGRKQGLRGSYLDGNIAQVGAMKTADEIAEREVRRQSRRRTALVDAAEDLKEWATDELFVVGDRFADSDGAAFGYVVSAPSAHDRSEIESKAQDIARRHGAHYAVQGCEAGWNCDDTDVVVIFSDDPSAVIIAPEEFTSSGFATYSAMSAGVFKNIAARLEGSPKSAEQLKNKAKRLRQQLAAVEAQILAADNEEMSVAEAAGFVMVGRLAGSGSPFDGSGRIQAPSHVKLSKRVSYSRDSASDVKVDAAPEARSARDIHFLPTAPISEAVEEEDDDEDYIERGDEGAEVADVQRAMNYLIQAGLTVDGDFGAATDAAVREFQKQAGLGVDGKVGPRTIRAIVAEYEGEGTVAPKTLSVAARTVVAGTWFGSSNDYQMAAAAGLPGFDGMLPSGIGAIWSSKKKRAANKKKRQARKASRKPDGRAKFGQKGYWKDRKKARKATKAQGRRKGESLKHFQKRSGSSSMSKTRPSVTSSMSKTRPQGSRAQPGSRRSVSDAEAAAAAAMLATAAPLASDLPMDGGPPPGGGGGGGDMGGGGGGQPSGGGSEPEGGDFGSGDEEEEDDGLFVLGDEPEEEEEDTGLTVIQTGAEPEEEEDEDPGFRVISPSIHQRGPGRQIGVNPMGQPIYESGRIVIGRIR